LILILNVDMFKKLYVCVLAARGVKQAAAYAKSGGKSSVKCVAASSGAQRQRQAVSGSGRCQLSGME
jgi:hypothetical protein